MIQKHLIPQIVIDCAEKMLDPNTNSNIRQNFEERLEAIKEFCNSSLEQSRNQALRKRRR
jgi:hypothetical protein